MKVSLFFPVVHNALVNEQLRSQNDSEVENSFFQEPR